MSAADASRPTTHARAPADGAREPSVVVLTTEGGCMRPWIWPGGRLHVQRCTAEELRLGDIAVWFNGHSLVSHRVVWTSSDRSFRTRPDLRAAVDAPASDHELLGRAVRFERGRVSYRLDGRLAGALGRCIARGDGFLPRVAAALARAKRMLRAWR